MRVLYFFLSIDCLFDNTELSRFVLTDAGMFFNSFKRAGFVSFFM